MSAEQKYFRIRNFTRFQHYKDRCPPWIKLYASLLSDVKFNRMTEVQQLHLVKIWILASQNNNLLPFDPKIIRMQAGLNSRVVLDVFIEAGFIEEVPEPDRNPIEIQSKSHRDSIEITPKPDRAITKIKEIKEVALENASISLVPNKEVELYEQEKDPPPLTPP